MSRLGNARAGTARPAATARDLGKCWGNDEGRRREEARGQAGVERDRRPGGQHRQGAGHGLRAEGRQRPPRHRHEPGPGGLPALPEGDASRPVRPPLAGPRPVRALVRPLQPHPLHPALPGRLGPGAGGPQVAAHLGQQDPGPPGVRPHRRRRDDHRAARPGRRQRRGHGDGRPPRARAARPERRRGRVAVRPLRLRHGQRRRPRGGRERRGVVDRRHPAARQPRPDLRRQRDLDRGQHRDRVHRGRRRPLRGLRLARTDGRLDPRRPRQQLRLPGGRPGPVRRDPQGPARHRPAELHPAPHDHRLAGPQPPEHLQGPRLRARRRRGGRHQGDPRLRPGPDLRGPARRHRAHPQGDRARPGRAGRVADDVRRVVAQAVRRRRPLRAAADADPARPAGTPTCRPSRPTRRGWRPARPAARSSTPSPRRVPELLGRLGRPRRVQQHHHRGRAVVPAEGPLRPALEGRPVRRPGAALRHPRARHGRDHERHRRLQRHPRVRRHVPDVLRLHARRGPAGGHDGPAGDLRVDPRLHRPRRGRPDPPADRAPRRAARDPRPRRGPSGRRQRDRRLLARDPRAHRPPGRPDPHPPERPDVPAGRGGLQRHGQRRAAAATS